MLGGTSPTALNEVRWAGATGLLAELSAILEGERCEWLEEELCPGTINREELARGKGLSSYYQEETPSYVSGCPDLDGISSLQQVSKQGHNRRYTGRKRCVYCMWFDPGHAVDEAGFCKHALRAVEEWQSQSSPSILPGSLLQIVRDGFARKNDTCHLIGGAQKFASYHRWRKLDRRRHRYQGPEADEKDNKVSTTQTQTGGYVKSGVHSGADPRRDVLRVNAGVSCSGVELAVRG